jgi:predicted acyl esterase
MTYNVHTSITKIDPSAPPATPPRYDVLFMTLFLRKTTLLLVTCVAFSAALSAQGLEYVKSHYTKYEFSIPMRDGVKLFNAVYVPKDTSQTYPILLTRTPYGVGP